MREAEFLCRECHNCGFVFLGEGAGLDCCCDECRLEYEDRWAEADIGEQEEYS